MQPVIYYVATSVDGFIEPVDGNFDLYSTDPELVDDYLTRLRALGSVVMGRKTYDVGLRHGVTDPYPWLTTYVASRTLESTDPAITIIRDDLVGAVRTLRAADGPGIYLSGGGDLAAQLFAASLIDELVVKVSPILLGSGVPVVAHLPRAARLHLLDTKRYADGALLLRYQVPPP